MWIIAALVAVIIGALIPVLNSCDWSPVVRRRYINLGWEDGMRWKKPYTPPSQPTTVDEIDEYLMKIRLGFRSSAGTQPTTELDMSRQRFDYYMTGYEQALDYKREREGIIATRKTHLERIQQLDTEIRAAAKELKEPSC